MRHLLALLFFTAAALPPAVPVAPAVVVTRYASGAIASRSSSIGGRFEGVVERWYENGQPTSREVYWHGVKIGRHDTWWPDGHLRTSATYINDAYQGEFRSWYSSGQPYELRHFENGRESGLQQSWTEDGTLYLNYEARGGRHYGLINARPCLPADAAGFSKRVTP